MTLISLEAEAFVQNNRLAAWRSEKMRRMDTNARHSGSSFCSKRRLDPPSFFFLSLFLFFLPLRFFFRPEIREWGHVLERQQHLEDSVEKEHGS